MKRVYFDYNATTPVDPRIVRTMRDFELRIFGNPSSIHREGQKARAAIDFARVRIAKFLNAHPGEIIFTSGATEANNLALQGVLAAHKKNSRKIPHIVTTELEHHSVYDTVKKMVSRGEAKATFVKPDKNGQIAAKTIFNAIRPDTILISVIFVSNEIGSILPIRELGKLILTYNLKHKSKILFHTDAVQAAKFYNLNADKLNVDLMTLSAHKLYGPKGIGVLLVKKGTLFEPIFEGGSQEYGFRPGTQNTTGIIGFAKAVELLGSLETRQKQERSIRRLRDELMNNLLKIPGVELNGPVGENRSPDNLNTLIYGIDQDALITALDLAGVSASTGSACSSGSAEVSHVIKSLNKTIMEPTAVARFSLGRYTTRQDIVFASKQIRAVINRLRNSQR